MEKKLFILDTVVISLLYLFGFAASASFAKGFDGTWAALNLPLLGIMGAGGGVWALIRKRFDK